MRHNMKGFIIGFILATAISTFAAIITKPNTFSTDARIIASEFNDNFDTIYNDYNGNITDANIAADANVGNAKLNLRTITDSVRINETGTPLTLNNLTGTGPIFQVLDNGSTVFIINNGGNVGVSSAVPTAVFVVGISTLVVNTTGVGIGRVPGHLLDLQGRVIINARAQDGTNRFRIGSAENSGDLTLGSLSGDLVFRTPTSGILFSVNDGANTHLSITSNGDVVIGTNTATELLTLAGDAVIDFQNSSIVSKAQIGLAETASDLVPGTVPGDLVIRANTQSLIISADNGTSQHFTIQSNGKVAIGTTTASRLLTLKGDVEIGFINASGTEEMLIAVAESGNDITPGSLTGDTVFRTSTNRILFSTDDGSNTAVLISTSSFLHVKPPTTEAGDVELEVSDGSSTGGGDVHRAAAGTHSSRSIKSDIRPMTPGEKQQRFNDVKNLDHVEFRYMVHNSTGTFNRNPNGKLRKGLILEDSPASIVDGQAIIIDDRVLNLEIALQILIKDNNDLKDRVDTLEVFHP